MDGRAYLEKLIADGLRTAIHPERIRGVAVGLVAAGALGQEEADQIQADLVETLRGTGKLQLVTGRGSAHFPVNAERVGTRRPEWRQMALEPPPPELGQVVPLAGRTWTLGVHAAILLSLEAWSTMLVLSLAYQAADMHALRGNFGPELGWRGWDDVGTQYQGHGGGALGAQGLVIHRCVWTPGPPDQARQLTLVCERFDSRITIDLP